MVALFEKTESSPKVSWQSLNIIDKKKGKSLGNFDVADLGKVAGCIKTGPRDCAIQDVQIFGREIYVMIVARISNSFRSLNLLKIDLTKPEDKKSSLMFSYAENEDLKFKIYSASIEFSTGVSVDMVLELENSEGVRTIFKRLSLDTKSSDPKFRSGFETALPNQFTNEYSANQEALFGSANHTCVQKG